MDFTTSLWSYELKNLAPLLPGLELGWGGWLIKEFCIEHVYVSKHAHIKVYNSTFAVNFNLQSLAINLSITV